MSAITSSAILGYCNYTKRTIAYAMYKIGNATYKAGIEDITVNNGKVEVTFKIETGSSASGTVTEIQLYDTDQNLWLRKTENLKLESVEEGFLYVVQISITETEV
ncbi:MAG: hypothetical protein IJ206_09100 [Oscillospiraceae bacterium]|nr:hypothetical protein [Oscillospiraceae bacterium]